MGREREGGSGGRKGEEREGEREKATASESERREKGQCIWKMEEALETIPLMQARGEKIALLVWRY